MSPRNSRTHIPKIFRRVLPRAMPTEEAIKSWKQTEVSYDPDLWDSEYVTYRYLSGLSDQSLLHRYQTLARSMPSYIAEKRAVIPLNSYQSAWYWYRKEHHTRLEFAIRDLDPPDIAISPRHETFKPETQVVPDGSEILFKYGKQKYMREMVFDGRIRFSPAESYEDLENNEARRDEELRKHSYKPRMYTRITTEDGKEVPILSDVRHTVGGPDYHLLCLSCVWDDQLFEAFEADSCVVINNPEEFARRVEAAGISVFPNWYFHHSPVQYFDPFDVKPKEFFDSANSKDFLFAYQNEYRLLWANLEGQPVSGHQFVTIEDASDIMDVYDSSGAKLT